MKQEILQTAKALESQIKAREALVQTLADAKLALFENRDRAYISLYRMNLVCQLANPVAIRLISDRMKDINNKVESLRHELEAL